MNYQRMPTMHLKYWHIYGKEEIEEWEYKLQRRDKTPTNLCYRIVTKLIHSWQRVCNHFLIYEDLPILPSSPLIFKFCPPSTPKLLLTLLFLLPYTRYQVYLGLTHNEVFCQCFDLISHTQIKNYNTHKGQETNSPM